jgi:hypothetical protein
MPFLFHCHSPSDGLRGDIMGRPQETFKKREKDMKRREKRERKMQRRLEKKALAQEGEAAVASDDSPEITEEPS